MNADQSILAKDVTGAAAFSGVVHRPKSVAEVQALVLEARRRKIALHPTSTGLNWGYGHMPQAGSDIELMDLSGLDRILNADQISVANPVAVIEPGVTQGQLSDFLLRHHPGLFFNVTGSARSTSIVGNALDRGVGYLGPRRDDLFGMELVTGAGTVLSTGFRRLGDSSPLAHCHPFGLGPMLDGLFFQGNFGVVTSACFKLLPRPAKQVAVSLALLNERDLPQFIDLLAGLKREKIMGSVTHIGNRARTRASLMYGIVQYLESEGGLSGAELKSEAERVLALVAPDQWTSLGGIAGTAKQVRAAMDEVRSRMRGVARVMFIDDFKLDIGFAVLNRFRFIPWAKANAAAISAIRPLHGLAAGIPTDAAIDNLLWRFGRADLAAERLAESNCGMLFISPALPMDGAFATRAVARLTSIAAGFSHELYVTINIETDNSMVAVTNLLFDRADEVAVERAHLCAAALHAEVRVLGLEVYRARVDMMPDVVSADSEYWRVIRQLKNVFDPDNVISPGRYNFQN